MQQAQKAFFTIRRTAAFALVAGLLLSPSVGRAVAAAADAEGLERAFVEVSDRVGPAVVSIVASYTVVQRYSPWGDEFQDEILRQWFNAPAPREQRQDVVSSGSGVIVSTDGYILTNAHVIGQAKLVKVKLLSGREYKAKIIGKDEDTDLAYL